MHTLTIAYFELGADPHPLAILILIRRSERCGLFCFTSPLQVAAGTVDFTNQELAEGIPV